MKHAILGITLAITLPAIAAAELKNESLIQHLPNGYKVDYQARNKKMSITEMVPASETVENWTEMVTTQVFYGPAKLEPVRFQALMAERWRASCKGAQAVPIAKGEENGYPFAVWMLACPLLESSGKPEWTWFKAIRGKDSFYVVQKAFRYKPGKEQVTRWMRYLKQIYVCDTRYPDQACPDSLQGVTP